MSKPRGIDDDFISDLKSGTLNFFFKKVKLDPSLKLEIRHDYINIYYKGGNLLNISKRKKGYNFHFDPKYCLKKKDTKNYDKLKNLDSSCTDCFKNNFDLMKKEMDSWFLGHPKPERDFQHQLLIHNQNIIDIEYQYRFEVNSATADGKALYKNPRIDMLYYNEGTLYLTELKYGCGAIGGKSGIKQHHEYMHKLIENDDLKKDLKDSVVGISSSKNKLGISGVNLSADDINSIEVLFLFADYNFRSKQIQNACAEMNKDLTAKCLHMASSETKINPEKFTNFFDCECQKAM